MVKFQKSDSADTCAGKFLLVSMGGRVEGLACADQGARTPIGASGNFSSTVSEIRKIWQNKKLEKVKSDPDVRPTSQFVLILPTVLDWPTAPKERD
jgi:hypothetical protein